MDPRAKIVAADLQCLEAVQTGLGLQAADYVLTAEQATVLATLSSVCTDNPLQAGCCYIPSNSQAWPRRQLLAQAVPFDIPFAHRYTEVLLASCQSLPRGAAGSEKVGAAVRVFFTETLTGINESERSHPPKPSSIDPQGFTLQTAIEMCRLLGGDEVDLIDVLYHGRGDYYGTVHGELYGKVVDIKTLLEAHPQATAEAGARIAIASRAVLVRELHKMGLSQQPDFIDFMLDRAADSAKSVREVAGAVLSEIDPVTIEASMIERLGAGNVTTRAAMVDQLAKTGTDTALDALRAHREKEKTARIVSAIDTALTVSVQSEDDTDQPDTDSQYQALDGSIVTIPPLRAIPEGEPVQFGDADRKVLRELLDAENERIKQLRIVNKKAGHRYLPSMIDPLVVDQTLALFNADNIRDFFDSAQHRKELQRFASWVGRKWVDSVIDQLPPQRALPLAVALSNSNVPLENHDSVMQAYLNAEYGDVRQVVAIECDMQKKVWLRFSGEEARSVQRGDLLRCALMQSWWYMESNLDEFPQASLWPYIAENLDVIDEAFGLKAQQGGVLDRAAAIRMLNRLPKPPARYFGQLLEAATGETRAGRAEARAMLTDIPGVQQHLFRLLDDSRQAIRAGAAEWIAARADTDAIEPIKKRLKKEKSELARAAMLTALTTLGEDIGVYVGPDALLEEAEKGLKKARFDKLDWLGLTMLPGCSYRDGQPVPPDVLRWWIFLAAKLKQPGGNAMFNLYLERLVPDDAEAFSTWILDSWCNYDTVRPSEEEGNAYARQHAQQRFDQYKKWYKDYTLERAHDELKREYRAVYQNSGAATKGLLALARHAPGPVAAERVRAYLKTHGARTSQASSLLQLLAANGDPASLQVVISAATRLKQKGVQRFAATLIEEVAAANSWTLDELADRTVPVAGLDDDGTMALLCGEDEKAYQASIGDALTLELRNPDGKLIKSLPAGQDDNTKAAKKQLSSSRRELKQVVAMQSQRLYEALCSERSWPLADYLRDIIEHPVMRKLAERTVWLGLNEDGTMVAAFRPTEEGDYTNAADEDVDISAFAGLRLAHGALMTAEDTGAWQAHLKDYEVKPVFTQFGRELLTLDEASGSKTAIEDRKGWVTDTFTIRGIASKLGYERGEAMDAGYFNEYFKTFQSAGIRAVIEFSGNCLPEENVPAATIALKFQKGRSSMKLSDVPPVLLSECWNDYRALAAKAAFDENWKKQMPWM